MKVAIPMNSEASRIHRCNHAPIRPTGNHSRKMKFLNLFDAEARFLHPESSLQKVRNQPQPQSILLVVRHSHLKNFRGKENPLTDIFPQNECPTFLFSTPHEFPPTISRDLLLTSKKHLQKRAQLISQDLFHNPKPREIIPRQKTLERQAQQVKCRLTHYGRRTKPTTFS